MSVVFTVGLALIVCRFYDWNYLRRVGDELFEDAVLALKADVSVMEGLGFSAEDVSSRLLYFVATDDGLLAKIRLAARFREQLRLMINALSAGVEGLNSSGEMLMKSFERKLFLFITHNNDVLLEDTLENRDKVEALLAELWEWVPEMHVRFLSQWEYELVELED